MLPRITGTETEYSINIRDNKGKDRQIEGEAGSILARRPAEILSLNSFLSNGARLYPDLSTLIEYATPEDTSFAGTTASEIASERILREMMEASVEAGTFQDYSVNKRVNGIADANGAEFTWGYHENYASPASAIKIKAETLALLGLHLATRNIYAGAGCVRLQRQNAETVGSFAIAQKAFGLSLDYSPGTLSQAKAVVNLRDEPWADANEWLRVHVTSGDVNISPWATRMKLGTTSLVLRLIEDGYDSRDFNFPSGEWGLTTLAKHTASDTSLRKPFRFSEGKNIRPLEVQYDLMAAARQLQTEVDLPLEEKEILDEWERALEDLGTDPSRLKDRADWTAKKAIVERRMDKHGVSLESRVALGADLQYDLLDEKGIGMQLRKTLWKNWMPDEDLIVSRLTTPPQDTRACKRARFVEKYQGVTGAKIGWNFAGPDEKNLTRFDNPYDFAE